MPHTFSDIDPQLRAAGRLAKFMLRPSKTGFRLLNRMLNQSVGKGLKQFESATVFVPRSTAAGEVRTRIFMPKNMAGPLPVLLHLHGGGYAMGTPEQDLPMFKQLLMLRDCIIVSPDYRLSLTDPYPAGLDDCYDTLLWIKANIAEYGGRLDQIVVFGESAGGGLTVATCLRAQARGDVNIAFQMPLYPMIDNRQRNPSAVGNTMPGWSSTHNKLGWELYLRDLPEGLIPAEAAPVHAETYAGLPPVITFIGELDPFLDETNTFVERLRADNVPVQYEVFPRSFHGFEIMAPEAEVSKAAIAFWHAAFEMALDTYFAPQRS